ncbi:MAG: VC0807 family protein [Steroidobacteraceae bacterium]
MSGASLVIVSILNPKSSAEVSRPPIGGIVWTVALNAVVPVLMYQAARRYGSFSEFAALAVAAVFPIVRSGFELLVRQQIDPIAILILLGIGADCVSISLGGSTRLLLVRESVFTGALGLACFVSLLLPRPMMFYFGRFFFAGTDPIRVARFNSAWQFPEVRFTHRLITVVWGLAFVGDLLIRILLIAYLPAALVLIISPIVLGVMIVSVMTWAFAYGGRVRARTMKRFEELDSSTNQ